MASKSSEIPINDLNVQQLNQVNQQLEQEIEFMQNSLQQLKMVQTKFIESQDSLSKIVPENEGKTILVPLTSSMYVPGQLDDPNNVLVDIGTGYYVEKSNAAAKEHFKRKVEYLTKQMEKIQPLMQEKFKMKQGVMEILQMKMQTQMAAQQQSGSAKS